MLKAIDFLRAKQDLQRYPPKELKALHVFYETPKNLQANDKLWYLATRILQSTKRVEFTKK